MRYWRSGVLSRLPAADLAVSTVIEGADLVIVNQGETALDNLAIARIDQSAGETLPDLMSSIL